MPAISFTNQLGFNRTSSVFLVGENLELHARFVSGSAYSFAINRIVGQTYYATGVKEPCVPDSVLRVAEGGGVTLLKLIFNDAKTSDDGLYSLTVTEGGQKKESKYRLNCTSNGPVISDASFKIFDSSKSGTVTIKSKVGGTVVDYNWLGSEDLGAELIMFSDLNGLYHSPNLTFSPQSAEGRMIYLQAVFAEAEVGVLGQFYDDIAYYGLCAKPAKGWTHSALPKEVALGASVAINVTFPTAVPVGAQAYLVIVDNGKDAIVRPVPSGSFNAARNQITASIDVSDGFAEFILYRADTKQAKVLGRVATVAAPVVGSFFPAGPILCKTGAKVKLIAPNTTGTLPIVVEWFLTSDAGKSWQSIGKGESITHLAKSGGLISCRATNKFGTDFSDTMLTLTVSPRAAGVAKKTGEK